MRTLERPHQPLALMGVEWAGEVTAQGGIQTDGKTEFVKSPPHRDRLLEGTVSLLPSLACCLPRWSY